MSKESIAPIKGTFFALVYKALGLKRGRHRYFYGWKVAVRICLRSEKLSKLNVDL